MKRFVCLLMFCLFLVGCGSDTKETKTGPIEGVEAKLDIASNSEALDEGIFQATFTNTTDETFEGSITFFHSSFKFWKEEIRIPPRKDVVRNLKTKYIKYPKDEYTYKVEGEMSNKSFASSVEYKLFKTDTERAFNVQTENITKENVIEITNELYSKYGDGLVNLNFYDGTQTLKDGEHPDVWPVASYIKNSQSKTITIDDETFDFETK